MEDPSAALTPDHSPPISAAPPAPPPRMAPVAATERILTLDVLRGFALLGIFMVNMQFFAMPFMRALSDPSLPQAPASEQLTRAFVQLFFEYKFVSLFSLLFGIGFTVQLLRAKACGAAFVPVYLRRLGVLALIGLTHALLLWYGDILFIYSVAALTLFISMSLRPRTLILIGAVIVLVSASLSATFAVIIVMMENARPQTTTAVTTGETATNVPASDTGPDLAEPDTAGEDQTVSPNTSPAPPRIFADLNPETGDYDPNSERWQALETSAYQEGPFIQALIMRAITYGYCLAFSIFGFGWHVIAMFMVGAGLMKLDFFSRDRIRWHWRFTCLFLPLGFAIESANTYLAWATGYAMDWPMVAAAALHEFGSVLMCLGYVGIWCLIVDYGVLRPVTFALSRMGRMALTNYLTQTVVTTSIMYWWGLGWFGDVSRVQQVGLVALIYGGQIVLSMLWLQVFSIGPMEWLWRSLTYLRPQPVRLRAAPSQPGEAASAG